MQRFVNLKVGSVFGFLHPETAFSVSVFQQKTNIFVYYKPKTEIAVSSCSSFYTAHCNVSPFSENNEKKKSKHTDVILRSSRHRQALTQKKRCYNQKKKEEKKEENIVK